MVVGVLLAAVLLVVVVVTSVTALAADISLPGFVVLVGDEGGVG